jgi:predicted nucleic acid-binding protein
MSPAAIHLDTDFLIRSLRHDSTVDGTMRSWLEEDTALAMSTVAWTEFLCGPVTDSMLDLAARLVPECIPFDDRDATLAARLFNASGRRRGSLADCVIAATAIRHDAALATLNTTDFRPLEPAGLRLA